MSEDEINKIINNFMNERKGAQKIIIYTSSLDSLVPVWESIQKKTGHRVSNRLTIFEDKCVSDLSTSSYVGIIKSSNSIRFSAAEATANAILELKEII